MGWPKVEPPAEEIHEWKLCGYTWETRLLRQYHGHVQYHTCLEIHAVTDNSDGVNPIHHCSCGEACQLLGDLVPTGVVEDHYNDENWYLTDVPKADILVDWAPRKGKNADSQEVEIQHPQSEEDPPIC